MTKPSGTWTVTVGDDTYGPYTDPCSMEPITVSPEVLEDKPSLYDRLLRRLNNQAAELIRGDFDIQAAKGFYSAGAITTEEAAKALGLDANTVPTTVETPNPDYFEPPKFDYTSWFLGQSEPLTPQRVIQSYEPRPEPEVLDLSPYSYMSTVHRPELLVENATECLADVDFDTLVGTGLSGTLAVVELARKLGKNYLIVRKPSDGTHSSSMFEGLLGKRWVFVDDLVDTGSTFARVYDAVTGASEDRSFTTEFVGSFLYNMPGFFSPSSHRTLDWFYKSERYDGRFGEATKPFAW